jgi:prophage regulatory protein
MATAIGDVVTSIPSQKSDAGFIRLRDLTKRIPVSKSTIWLWVQERKFPAPVKLSERVTAWSVASVETWEAEKRQSAKVAYDRG